MRKKVKGLYGGKKTKYRQTESTKRYTTDPELLKEFHTRLGRENVTFEDAKFLLDEVMDSIKYVVEKNSSVNIRAFGTFHLGISKRSKMYVPSSGKTVNIPLRYHIKFKPSGSFKGLINSKVKKNIKVARDIGEGEL